MNSLATTDARRELFLDLDRIVNAAGELVALPIAARIYRRAHARRASPGPGVSAQERRHITRSWARLEPCTRAQARLPRRRAGAMGYAATGTLVLASEPELARGCLYRTRAWAGACTSGHGYTPEGTRLCAHGRALELATSRPPAHSPQCELCPDGPWIGTDMNRRSPR